MKEVVFGGWTYIIWAWKSLHRHKWSNRTRQPPPLPTPTMLPPPTPLPSSSSLLPHHIDACTQKYSVDTYKSKHRSIAHFYIHNKHIKFHYQTLFKNMQISWEFRACIFRYHCHAQLIKMHPFLSLNFTVNLNIFIYICIGLCVRACVQWLLFPHALHSCCCCSCS